MRFLLTMLVMAFAAASARAQTKEDEAAKAAVAVELALLKLKNPSLVGRKVEVPVGFAVSANIVRGKYDTDLRLSYREGTISGVEKTIDMQASNVYGMLPGDKELSGFHDSTEIIKYVETHPLAKFSIHFGYVWMVDFRTEEKAKPVPKREQLVLSDGVYEKGDDGTFRKISDGGAPGVVPAKNFQSGQRHAGHTCPACGRSQFVVASSNRDGTHNHRCPYDGTVWSH